MIFQRFEMKVLNTKFMSLPQSYTKGFVKIFQDIGIIVAYKTKWTFGNVLGTLKNKTENFSIFEIYGYSVD